MASQKARFAWARFAHFSFRQSAWPETPSFPFVLVLESLSKIEGEDDEELRCLPGVSFAVVNYARHAYFTCGQSTK